MDRSGVGFLSGMRMRLGASTSVHSRGNTQAHADLAELEGSHVVSGLDGIPGGEARSRRSRVERFAALTVARFLADPVEVGQPSELDNWLTRERMISIDDQHVRLVEQMLGAQPCWSLVVAISRHQVEVNGPIVQGTVIEVDPQRQIGEPCLDRLHRLGQPDRGGRGKTSNGEAAGAARLEVAHPCLDVGQLSKHAITEGSQLATQRRWLDPATHLRQQGESGLALQRRDMLTDGRRRVTQVGRSGMDGAAGDDGAKDPKAVHIKHDLILCQYRTVMWK